MVLKFPFCAKIGHMKPKIVFSFLVMIKIQKTGLAHIKHTKGSSSINMGKFNQAFFSGDPSNFDHFVVWAAICMLSLSFARGQSPNKFSSCLRQGEQSMNFSGIFSLITPSKLIKRWPFGQRNIRGGSSKF